MSTTYDRYGQDVLARMGYKLLAEAYINKPHNWTTSDSTIEAPEVVRCFFPTVSKEPDDLHALAAWDIDAEEGRTIFGFVRCKNDYIWHVWYISPVTKELEELESSDTEVFAVQNLIDRHYADKSANLSPAD